MNASAATAAPDLLRALEALAEPSRLRILRLLDREELAVGELAECTGLPQSSVSRHLASLRAAGFVDERPEGARTMARRAVAPQPSIAPLLDAVLAVVRSDAFGHDADLAALDRLRAARAEGRDALFDALAGDWDALREEVLGGRPTRAEVAALLVPPGQTLVDAGTGTGVLLPWLSAIAGPRGRVIGVERSAAMAARACERAGGLPNVEVIRGRIEDLPVGDGTADVVLLSLSLGHSDDPDAVLRRAARALRPGGRLVVADIERHDDTALVARLGEGFRGFEPSELLAALARAGLSDARRIVLEAPDARTDETARGARRRPLTRLTPLFCVATAPERRTRGGTTRRTK